MKSYEPREKRLLLVRRNERLTALAGILLLVIITVELLITADLHALIPIHIFIGVVLSGPLIVKLFSAGYRFVRYYAKHPEFVEHGPPNIWLRLLAPALVLMTILVFVSGFGLALAGPTNSHLFFDIHAASTALWIPLVAVHVYAHIRKARRLIASDWNRQSADRVPGRTGRLRFTLTGLVVGLLAAVLMIPVSTPWDHWIISPVLPTPLVLGVMAAVFGIIIAVPLLRDARDS